MIECPSLLVTRPSTKLAAHIDASAPDSIVTLETNMIHLYLIVKIQSGGRSTF